MFRMDTTAAKVSFITPANGYNISFSLWARISTIFMKYVGFSIKPTDVNCHLYYSHFLLYSSATLPIKHQVPIHHSQKAISAASLPLPSFGNSVISVSLVWNTTNTRSAILSEKLIFAWQVNKFPIFYVSRCFFFAVHHGPLAHHDEPPEPSRHATDSSKIHF